MRQILHYAISDGVPWRSLWVAVIVGTILNLINQGSAIWPPHRVNLTKLILTYIVPYFVATYGAVSARVAAAKEDRR